MKTFPKKKKENAKILTQNCPLSPSVPVPQSLTSLCWVAVSFHSIRLVILLGRDGSYYLYVHQSGCLIVRSSVVVQGEEEWMSVRLD